MRLQWRGADVRDWFAATLAEERDTGTRYHLAPGFLALGVATYFSLHNEPLAWVVAAVALALAVAALQFRVHGAGHFLVVAAALFFAGMTAAQWRTARVAAPMIVTPVTAEISGRVIAVDRSRNGAPRYLLRPLAIAGLAAGSLPRLVRIGAPRGSDAFSVGDTISGRARIQPVPGPAMPGGYDFRFFAAYDGLAATGYFLRAPQITDSAVAASGSIGSFLEACSIAINRLRQTVGSRIRATLGSGSAELAVALITGDRSAIPQKVQDDLRKSGLAHLLAISGLHMALVTLTVIGAIRAGAALVPALALRYPVRKWAAGFGLLAATFYLLLSGASVPTQRSWLMIAVMVFALMADRRALTLRNVSTAALAILLLTPESLLEPGFQMSFSATAALVAGFGLWSDWRQRRATRFNPEDRGWIFRTAANAIKFLGGIAATSLMAGTATSIYTAWHFHQVTLLGLLGNGLAMPVVSLATMPLALIACLAMPFGFEAPFLHAYGWSLQWVVAVAGWVAEFSDAQTVDASPALALAMASLGLFVLLALSTRLRWAGLAILLAALPLFGSAKKPQLLIAEDGRTVAIADAAGRLVPVWPKRNRFVRDIWLGAYSENSAGEREGRIGDCDRDLCILRPYSPAGVPVVWLVYAPDRLAEACRSADIVLAPRLRWVNCRDRKPRLILKRGDFEHAGTHAIRLIADPKAANATQTGSDSWTVAIETARGQPNRPWEQWFAIPEPPDKPFTRSAPSRSSTNEEDEPDYRR